MPTKHKRIPVTLEPELYDALKEYAEASGTSLSASIRVFIRASLPVIKMAAQAITMLKQGDKNAFSMMDTASMNAMTEMLNARAETLESCLKQSSDNN